MTELDKLKEITFEEGNEILDTLDGLLVELERNPGNKETLHTIFRHVHTLKGSMGAIEFEPLEKFTHIKEDLLDHLRGIDDHPTPEIIDALFKSVDVTRDVLGKLQHGEELPHSVFYDVEEVIRQFLPEDWGDNQGIVQEAPDALDIPLSVEFINELTESEKDIVKKKADAGERLYSISIKFDIDVFRQAIDPLTSLRILKDNGTICAVRSNSGSVPDLNEFNPADFYINDIKVIFSSPDLSRSNIVEIYEFVLENGEINVHQISPAELSEHFDVELDPFWLESSEEGSEYIDETMTPDDSSMSIEEKLKLQSAEHLNELKDRADYIEKLIKKIKKKPKNAKEDELNDLFRFFHNIHGDSGILGLTELTTISEPLEMICDELRSGELKLTADIAVKLIHGVESIREYIGKFNSVPDNLVSSYSKDSPTVDTPNRINQDNIQPTQGQASLKIDAERLDALMEMVGELVIAQALVSQDEAMSNLADGRLEKNVSQVDKLTKNIQDQVMSLRLLPLKYTFSKMSRVVRDVSRRADKEVRLNVTGDETEVDKSIIDHIGDPLTHLVRNCVDHGIEGPEDRASAGKSFEGVVDLKAYHQGGSVVIEVLDDGAGLSREDIYNKAKEKGLLTEVMEHDDTKLFNVIFEPGFSTAKEITEISGRGVGLDVVKKDIEKLRGRVDVSSTKGEGTTFTLRFPLTTASIEGMVVKVGVDRYIIPTLSIETSFKPAASDITVVAGQGEVVKIRDELHPVIRLRKLFTDNGVGQDMKDSIFILVEGNGRKCCVVVDEILGHQHVVIKSLSDTFSGLIAISGCTILGDGRVGLILDVGGVVDVAFN